MKVVFKILILLSLLSGQALALIDYTDNDENVVDVPATKSAPPVPKNRIIKRAPQKRSSGGGGESLFAIGTQYESIDVEANDRSGKIHLLKAAAHFQTPYKVYLDVDYWAGKTSDSDLSRSSTTQKGNPEAKLGFNWFRLGNGSEAATVDVYGGFSLGQTDSELATTRSDKFFGVESAKRVMSLGFALGYELRLTGSPDGDTELDIGNIKTLKAAIGWEVSGDIRVEVEGGTHKISKGTDPIKSTRLKDDISFGYVSPAFTLGLSPLIDLELGGVFRTKRNKETALIDARLWNIKGAYGNSIFTSLSFGF